MSTKTYTTAVVLIPPLEIWPSIQAIRQRHDRHARRWMPHVTLLYPFRLHAEFEAIGQELAAVCAKITSFTLELRDIGLFTHGARSATLWLVPEPAGPLLTLQTALWQAVPDCDDTRKQANGFTPHLSLGQAAGAAEAARLRAELLATWTPQTWCVDTVSMIWRNTPPDDRFREAIRLPLASGSSC